MKIFNCFSNRAEHILLTHVSDENVDYSIYSVHNRFNNNYYHIIIIYHILL